MPSKHDRIANANSGLRPLNATPQKVDTIYSNSTRVVGIREFGSTVQDGLPITGIYPDLRQARRAFPSSVRSHWSRKPDLASMMQLFTAWLAEVHAERALAHYQKSFDFDAYFGNSAEVWDSGDINESAIAAKHQDAEYLPGAIELGWLKIVVLANSIYHDGLENPINVYVLDEKDETFRIEAGECRWLAYHFISWVCPDESAKWENIPAQVVDNFSARRQAAENNIRQGLNAIQKARQYANLMFDFHQRKTPNFHVADLEACANDHTYYLQAYELRTPHGMRDSLMQLMGVSSPAEIARCRELLMLHDRVWDIADDYNVAQADLFDLKDLPEDEALKKISKMIHRGSFLEKSGESESNPDKTEKSVSATKAFGLMWKSYEKGRPIKRSDFVALKGWIAEVEKSGVFED